MIGTFLEYFDLMLYVHMASILNDVFFDTTSGFNEKYGAAFAFCSTFLLKPFGGFFMGYLGDKYGRKERVDFEHVHNGSLLLSHC